MWELLLCDGIDWIKFTVERMFHSKETPNWSLFFTSFVKFILELNGIISDEVDLLEAPKKVEK